MILRDEFEKYLYKLYSVDTFEDYCINGLVVEGKTQIEKIGFGVSFNLPFLNEAIAKGCDAIVVHHGIFKDGFFSLKGYLKKRVKLLIENEISLFSIHLPMDAHPEVGHNALMFKAIGADITDKLSVGFIGKNVNRKSMEEIAILLQDYLVPEIGTGSITGLKIKEGFGLETIGDFSLYKNGPDIPEIVAIVSGGSSGLYEEAIDSGVDTFICGEVKEHIPSISFETKTNFLNIGHYYSERPGILALKDKVDKDFDIGTLFIEIPNPV